jgi:hypothetical protein
MPAQTKDVSYGAAFFKLGIDSDTSFEWRRLALCFANLSYSVGVNFAAPDCKIRADHSVALALIFFRHQADLIVALIFRNRFSI